MKVEEFRERVDFQMATLIYDATWRVCDALFEPGAIMADLLRQGARRGRLDIAENARMTVPASRSTLRLLNAARTAFGKLLIDYEDVLRQRQMEQWVATGPVAASVSRVLPSCGLSSLSNPQRRALYAQWLDGDPTMQINALMVLIGQLVEMLDQQIAEQERPAARSWPMAAGSSISASAAGASDAAPVCPKCGKPMALRTAKSGANAGHQFWGCTGYPDCKGVINHR